MDKCKELYDAAHRLLYPDFSQAYFDDDLTALQWRVSELSDELIVRRGSTPEAEGALCLALLMGCCASVCDDGAETCRKQAVLDRIERVLPKLPASLLKCRLLTFAYGEVFDERLAAEALSVFRSWEGRPLSAEETEIRDTLCELMQYPVCEKI